VNIKLGVVGVGSHGRWVANACMAEGAEIVAYDRHKADAVYGLGKRMPWQEMVAKGSELDGVLAMADPKTTLEVVTEAVKNGVAVLATKPLMVTDIDLLSEVKAPFMIDHWRLWSPDYRKIAEKFHSNALNVKGLRVKAFGNGPKRDFSSAFDYGWHAMAFVFDLLGATCNTLDEINVTGVDVLNKPDGRQLFVARSGYRHWPGSGSEGLPIELIFGNGGDEKTFEIEVAFSDGFKKITWPYQKDAGFQHMISGFLRSVNDKNRVGSARNIKEMFMGHQIYRALNTILKASASHQ